MMNFRKIAAASKGHLILRYFTENTPEPIHPAPVDAAGRQLEEGGRLTAYYTGRDSRATWRPDMPAILAGVIGIDPRKMPRDAEMSRLFEARRADTGEAWSRHTRKLSGFDLVFSPHKSVSLAAEFAATPSESAALWNAVDRAADRAMRYVAQVLGWARKGAGGEDGADPGAVGWISFRHHTARPTLQMQDGSGGQTYLFDAPVAGDPHMHVHNFLMNLVVTAEGRVGSLDTRALTDARVKEFGAYFQAILADELRQLGIQADYDADEQAIVVTAIPEDVNRAFSKRDKQILHKAKRFAESQGLDWDDLSIDKKLDIVEAASADGRLGKMKSDEKRIWREQAASLGWQHQTVMEDATHDRLPDQIATGAMVASLHHPQQVGDLGHQLRQAGITATEVDRGVPSGLHDLGQQPLQPRRGICGLRRHGVSEILPEFAVDRIDRRQHQRHAVVALEGLLANPSQQGRLAGVAGADGHDHLRAPAQIERRRRGRAQFWPRCRPGRRQRRWGQGARVVGQADGILEHPGRVVFPGHRDLLSSLHGAEFLIIGRLRLRLAGNAWCRATLLLRQLCKGSGRRRASLHGSPLHPLPDLARGLPRPLAGEPALLGVILVPELWRHSDQPLLREPGSERFPLRPHGPQQVFECGLIGREPPAQPGGGGGGLQHRTQVADEELGLFHDGCVMAWHGQLRKHPA